MRREKIKSKIIEVINITDSTYVLRLERNGFQFKAGQYLVLEIPGEKKAREYSIYSAENEPYIDLLIKEIDEGEVSKQLKYIKLGTEIMIGGPYGFFVMNDNVLQSGQKVFFIATGTGISPFRSIIRSNQDLNYQIIHGVRYAYEAYHKTDYPKAKHVLCTSADVLGDFNGRVNQYIAEQNVDKNALYYLCGNSDMVHDVTQILEKQGLSATNIKTEVFF